MRKSNNIIEQKIEDEVLVIPIVDGVAQMKQVCCLSNSGTCIWELLSETEEITEQEIIKHLSVIYNVPCEEIEEDVLSFVELMKKYKIVY